MRKEFYKLLSELYKSNPQVAILLGDIGVFSFNALFKDDASRLFNMGIMEQTMIGVAGGLARKGFIPFVHSIAPFVTERCYEQLKLALAYECRNVFVVSVGNSYDYAGLGATHHCTNDLKIVSAIPNFKVYCPGNPRDVEEIINTTIALPCPKYIRLSEYSNNLHEVFPNHKERDVLQVDWNGITIIVGNAIKDFRKLLSSDLKTTILYTYNISEFDVGIVSYLTRNCRIKSRITVVEPSSDSGIISKLALGLENIEKLNSIAVPNQFIDKYGSKQAIDTYLGLDDEGIIKQLGNIYS